MSGRTEDGGDSYPGVTTAPGLDAEFEADLQCAFSSTSPVLITGPADVTAALARQIHRNSLNHKCGFLVVDCHRVTLPEQLEAAFHAVAPRGAIFLRDVDRLTPAMQTILYIRMTPLGVRVIAGSSVNLLRAAAQGTFDERLFYRLNQIHLVATPARFEGSH